ncbi:hypothetical protein [Zestomonas carbonaria]|uniref:Uncharacterized protein n=1 Tax=Zestomonas carbonaria TaxID=2762745 RepID=A0A7U7ES02_9GAMM|nr:hypothetical protein [Pseudomonas carbonaria]CAD5110029.1 hypothetical protein PSEWESI4_04345 [Pseudomonas carbonaria]
MNIVEGLWFALSLALVWTLLLLPYSAVPLAALLGLGWWFRRHRWAKVLLAATLAWLALMAWGWFALSSM